MHCNLNDKAMTISLKKSELRVLRYLLGQVNSCLERVDDDTIHDDGGFLCSFDNAEYSDFISLINKVC